jgi:hypothetical protein
VTGRSWLERLRAAPPGGRPADGAAESAPANRARRRLIALLCLFDALLIAAVLVSFQATDLVEEERTLVETRTVYEILYQDMTITRTEVITQLLPYGSVP